MSVRSLNKVTLIGNLTRDPELRFTPAGTAVCTFGLATNRSWTTQTGETKEETEFHRIVSWNKLAELCAQLLAKGRKIYVEGRLATRTWTAQDGQQRTTTEIVIDDMIILDSKKIPKEEEGKVGQEVTKQASENATNPQQAESSISQEHEETASKKTKKESEKQTKGKDTLPKEKEEKTEEQPTDIISPDDIPF